MALLIGCWSVLGIGSCPEFGAHFRCWVVKSDRLFDAAVDVDLDAKLRACRDHLLLALRAGEIISRAAIIKIFGLSDTQISGILKKIARRYASSGSCNHSLGVG